MNKSITLPEKPVVVIEPSKGWIPVNVQDLWRYRDLLYILTSLLAISAECGCRR